MTLLLLFNQFLTPAGRDRRRELWELQRQLFEQTQQVEALQEIMAKAPPELQGVSAITESSRAVTFPADLQRVEASAPPRAVLQHQLNRALKELQRTERLLRAVRRRHEDEALTVLILST